MAKRKKATEKEVLLDINKDFASYQARGGRNPKPKKRWILPLLILITAAVPSFYFYSSSPDATVAVGTENEEDEALKNSILTSSQTDYSSPAKEVPLKIENYTVKSGDTIGEIAAKYGVSMDTICGSNGISTYANVGVGAKLKIPNKDGIIYTVKKGELLINISQKYRIDSVKISASNNLRNSDFLRPGLDLFIPDAKPLNMSPDFLWPVRSRFITSGFGWRNHPLSGEYRFHNGLDIRANYESVKVTKFGKVTYAGWMGGYGKSIVIAHPGGIKSLYGHLSRINVKNGQYVKQGQVIARSGNTGYSSGPHLHFEIIKNGDHINPHKYFKKKKK